MNGSRRARPFASDEWMLEQQMRAEMEAEAWRRLREAHARPPALPPPAAAPPAPALEEDRDLHRGGSALLKGLVRFMLSGFGAYLAFVAAMDARLGEFEVWLAVGAAFIVTLALTAFGPLRRFVHVIAETARWAIFTLLGFGALWVVLNQPPA